MNTTFFHSELPWILSASNDKLIRIWDHQKGKCIEVIEGHEMSVTCAVFDPVKDQIVSVSLDKTVRIWDIGGMLTVMK